MKKRMCLIVLSLTLVFSLFISCNQQESQDEESKENDVSQAISQEIIEEPDYFDDLENTELSLIWVNTREDYEKLRSEGKEDGIFMATRYYEERYNTTANVISVPWMDMMPKCIALQASGEAPDLLMLGSQQFPSVAMKNVVMPLEDVSGFDEARKRGYFNETVLDASTYKGKSYMLRSKSESVNISVLTFNKTMCDQNLVKTPYEYWLEGEWNYDNFAKVGKSVTKDIDGDGSYDVLGFMDNNCPVLFSLTNDAPMVLMKEDGTMVSNLLDPKLARSWDALASWFLPPEQGGFIDLNATTAEASFLESKVCMVGKFMNLPMSFKDKWGISPFPYGPDNTEKKSKAEVSGWGIPVGAKNPMGAMAWVSITDWAEDINKHFKQEFFDGIEDQEFAQMLWDNFKDPEKVNSYNYTWAWDQGYEDCYGQFARISYALAVEKSPATTVCQTFDSSISALLEKSYS